MSYNDNRRGQPHRLSTSGGNRKTRRGRRQQNRQTMNDNKSSTWIFAKMFKTWMLLVLFSVGCVFLLVGSDATRSGSQIRVSAASEARTMIDRVVPQIREPYQIEITVSKDRWHGRYLVADVPITT